MDEKRIRRIIHIDMDAFYASIEQRDDPALKGRPVAVGYRPSAASWPQQVTRRYEARRFGVRSAMPSTIAMRKCADLVFVPPRFDVYRAVSRQIHAIFTEYTPLSRSEVSGEEFSSDRAVRFRWGCSIHTPPTLPRPHETNVRWPAMLKNKYR
jgi:nucleotidyltransferase/DNA polymerase involved in DNA repair